MFRSSCYEDPAVIIDPSILGFLGYQLVQPGLGVEMSLFGAALRDHEDNDDGGEGEVGAVGM